MVNDNHRLIKGERVVENGGGGVRMVNVSHY